MSDPRVRPGGSAARVTPQRLDRSTYELEVEDTFRGPVLDRRLWIPHYLPHWSTRAASEARYEVGAGGLRLRIDADQPPWAPDLVPGLRVSSLQTGLLAGPVGSAIGQHRFQAGLTVREAQPTAALYTPRHGLFELRARANPDPTTMVAFWMIGYEDRPDRSAEICICEIFGRDVTPDGARVGMGLHPFGDPTLHDEFETVAVDIDVRSPHEYAAAWGPDEVAFYVDEVLVKVVRQSPEYPMQLMLDVFELADWADQLVSPEPYPKTFVVERVRGWRPREGPAARPVAFAAGPGG